MKTIVKNIEIVPTTNSAMDSDSDNEPSENHLVTGDASVAELIMLDEDVDAAIVHDDEVEVVGENIDIPGNPEVMEIVAGQIVEANDIMEGVDEDIQAIENPVVEEATVDDEPNDAEFAENGDMTDEDDAVSDDDDDVIEISHDYNPETIPNAALEELIDDWNKSLQKNCGGKNYFDRDYEEQNYEPLRKKSHRIGGDDVKIAVGRNNSVLSMPIRRNDEQGFWTKRSGGRFVEHDTYNNFLRIANHRFEVVRQQETPPDQDGGIFKNSFSKQPFVQQLINLSIDTTKIVERFDASFIQGMKVKEGVKMLTQITDLLVDVRNEIIPTTTERLKEALGNMAILTISSSNAPHRLEYFQAGKGPVTVSESPSRSGMSDENYKSMLANWLSIKLVPLLTRWSSSMVRKLPEALRSLSVFMGVDFEGFAVSKEQRGNCQKCGRQAKDCGIQSVYLMHLRIGTGTLFIAYNGMTKEEFARSDLKPTLCPTKIPDGSSCVPWTTCEAKEKVNMRAAFEVIVTLFFDEATSNSISVGFDVENAERRLLKEMMQIWLGKVIGFRIVESSAHKTGSLPNYALQRYLYQSHDGAKVRTASGIQTNWQVGRRMCSSLYKMPQQQGTFSLKNIIEDPEHLDHRDTLLFIFYHKMDSSMCYNMMLVSFVAVLMECPLLLAGGFKRYIDELIQIVTEACARRTTKDNTPWKTDVNMENAPNRIITPVKDLARTQAGTDQLSQFAAGAFSHLGVSAMGSFATRPDWSTTPTSDATGGGSEPLITTGKNKANKLNKFANNVGSNEILEECSAGVNIKMDKDLHKSLEPFEISDAPAGDEDFSMFDPILSEPEEDLIPVEAAETSSEPDVCTSPRKRTGEETSAVRRAEEPRNKKQAVEDDTTGEVVEHPGEDLEEIKKVLPMSDEIVDEISKKKVLTQEEAQGIIDKVQGIVDCATMEVVVRVSKTNKEGVLNRNEIAKRKEEAAELKNDYKKNLRELEQVLAKQVELREKMKEANKKVAQLQKEEFDRRKKERADAEKRHEKAKQEIVKAGAKLIVETQRRTEEVRVDQEAENVAVEVPQIVKDAPISQKVTKEMTKIVPAKLKPWEEKFVKYCCQRFSYMKLVLTIIKILERADNIIEEFDRERTNVKYRHGNFLGIAKLKNTKIKTRAKNEISWVNGRKLVGIIRKLAEFHLDPNEIEANEDILDTDEKPEKVRKSRANGNKNAHRLIKELGGQLSPVFQEITGEELSLPWPNPLIDHEPYDAMFLTMAQEIHESQDPRLKHLITLDQSRVFLEMQIQEYILPSKYMSTERVEIVEEEYVAEGETSRHFIMDDDIPEEMNDVGIIIPEGQNSVSIIRKV